MGFKEPFHDPLKFNEGFILQGEGVDFIDTAAAKKLQDIQYLGINLPSLGYLPAVIADDSSFFKGEIPEFFRLATMDTEETLDTHPMTLQDF